MSGGDDFERLSVRALKFLCEKEGIAIPLVPTKCEMIEAIRRHRHTPAIREPSPPPVKKRAQERFETPRIEINSRTTSPNAGPTPIYRNRLPRPWGPITEAEPMKMTIEAGLSKRNCSARLMMVILILGIMLLLVTVL